MEEEWPTLVDKRIGRTRIHREMQMQFGGAAVTSSRPGEGGVIEISQ
jgi:hypothetical protein